MPGFPNMERCLGGPPPTLWPRKQNLPFDKRRNQPRLTFAPTPAPIPGTPPTLTMRPYLLRSHAHKLVTLTLPRLLHSPHSLPCRTFDTDTVPVFGMEDDYTRRPEGTVTTRAQGEGAIEGVASDYQVREAIGFP